MPERRSSVGGNTLPPLPSNSTPTGRQRVTQRSSRYSNAKRGIEEIDDSVMNFKSAPHTLMYVFSYVTNCIACRRRRLKYPNLHHHERPLRSTFRQQILTVVERITSNRRQQEVGRLSNVLPAGLPSKHIFHGKHMNSTLEEEDEEDEIHLVGPVDLPVIRDFVLSDTAVAPVSRQDDASSLTSVKLPPLGHDAKKHSGRDTAYDALGALHRTGDIGASSCDAEEWVAWKARQKLNDTDLQPLEENQDGTWHLGRGLCFTYFCDSPGCGIVSESWRDDNWYRGRNSATQLRDRWYCKVCGKKADLTSTTRSTCALWVKFDNGYMLVRLLSTSPCWRIIVDFLRELKLSGHTTLTLASMRTL